MDRKEVKRFFSASSPVARKKGNLTAETQRTAEERREWKNTKAQKLMEISCLFRERPHCCDSRFNIIQERKNTMTISSRDLRFRGEFRDAAIFGAASHAPCGAPGDA